MQEPKCRLRAGWPVSPCAARCETRQRILGFEENLLKRRILWVSLAERDFRAKLEPRCGSPLNGGGLSARQPGSGRRSRQVAKRKIISGRKDLPNTFHSGRKERQRLQPRMPQNSGPNLVFRCFVSKKSTVHFSREIKAR